MLVICVAFICLFILLFLGIPIWLSMGLVGIVGFAYVMGWQPAYIMLGQVTLDSSLTYNFSVLPLFMLMGNFISRSQLAEDLYAAANSFLGHRRGGLAMATILACGGFSAVCGSSVACTATMTNVAVPSMKKHNYQPGFAAGSVVAGGTLGVLIPPSIAMVMIALITDLPLGELLIAGIIPGLLTIFLYILAIAIFARLSPSLAPAAEHADWAQRWRALKKVWLVLMLFSIILGGIYFGIFTAMEAAGIGAFGAFIIVMFRRALTWAALFEILMESAITSGMLFMVLIGALLFSNFVTVAEMPDLLGSWIGGLNFSPMVVLSCVLGVYLVLGCILDPTGLLLLSVPVFFPIMTGLGFDPIWFAVFVVIVTEVGLMTPPMGLNVFVVRSMLPNVPIQKIYRGILPFLAADIVRIALIIFIPGIVLFLPNLMN